MRLYGTFVAADRIQSCNYSQSLHRLLLQILDAEGIQLPTASVQAISDTSSGDIRQAIMRLQFLCVGFLPRSRQLQSLGRGQRKWAGWLSPEM